jgi:hypothetical protein
MTNKNIKIRPSQKKYNKKMGQKDDKKYHLNNLYYQYVKEINFLKINIQ